MIPTIGDSVTEFRDSDRGVSPVIGVALLIAVTVVLAAVIGFVVLGADTGPGTDEPSARLDLSGDAGAGTLTVDHEGGDAISLDNLEIKVGTNTPTEANNAGLSQSSLQTGETVTINEGDVTGSYSSGTTVTLLYDPPNTEGKTQLAEFTFP